jgi:hypothetical protein
LLLVAAAVLPACCVVNVNAHKNGMWDYEIWNMEEEEDNKQTNHTDTWQMPDMQPAGRR